MTGFSNRFSRKKNQMLIGMFASTIMVRNWDDASMHATRMRLVKINAWTSSKLGNSTALARYNIFRVFISY